MLPADGGGAVILCGYNGCRAKLTPALDPDEGICLLHGHRPLKQLAPLRLLHSEPFEKIGPRKDVDEPRTCMDCGIEVSHSAKRCKECSKLVISKALTGRKRGNARPIVLTPRRRDVLA